MIGVGRDRRASAVITPDVRITVAHDRDLGTWEACAAWPDGRCVTLCDADTLHGIIARLNAMVVGWVRRDGDHPARHGDGAGEIAYESLRRVGEDRYELVVPDEEGYAPILGLGRPRRRREHAGAR